MRQRVNAWPDKANFWPAGYAKSKEDPHASSSCNQRSKLPGHFAKDRIKHMGETKGVWWAM